MKDKRRIIRILFVLFVLVLVAGIGFTGVLLQSCGSDDDDDDGCLSWGENCTQQYKMDNYGTTDIQCCEGQCSDHGSGIVTCGS